MDLTTQTQVADPGAKLAHNMITVGVLAWIAGGLIFFFVNNASEDLFSAWALFFASVSSTGAILALLGLHALAVRTK